MSIKNNKKSVGSFSDMMQSIGGKTDVFLTDDDTFQTGIIPIDMIFGESMRCNRGSAIGIWSSSGLGKSTLMAQLSAKLSSVGEPCLYLDPEGGSMELVLKWISWLKDKFPDAKLGYHGAKTGCCFVRDINLAVRSAIKMHEMGVPDAPKHLFLDSLNKLVSHPDDLMDENGKVDDRLGRDAVNSKRFFDMWQPLFRKHGITLWCIIQARANINTSNPMDKKKTKMAVSFAGEHAFDVIAEVKGSQGSSSALRKGGFFGDSANKDRVGGRELKLFVHKNREGYPLYHIPIVTEFAKGLSNPHFYIEMLRWGDMIKVSGSWCTLDVEGVSESIKFQGIERAIEHVNPKSTNWDTIVGWCRDNALEFYRHVVNDSYGNKR